MDSRSVALLVVAGLPVMAQDYAGSRACVGCHAAIYKHWTQTPMGRSMSPASVHADKARAPVLVESTTFKRRFDVYVEDGVLYQSESGDAFRNPHRVEFAIGSGVNGYTFVVRRGNFLFQAPLSYYARPQKWDLSPGYEFADYGFNRPIHVACVACHSGRPRPAAERIGEYRDPPLQELSIGCENCHGPGSQHIAGAGKKGSIVNPAKISPSLAEDICMNCHQGGDTRVLQPGKTELDFRPGQPLDAVVSIFKFPGTGQRADSGGLLEHHESMRLSRCWQNSSKMTCLTCHNPHAAEVDYRRKCLSCHTKAFRAGHPARDSDCTSCHMPKRDVGIIAHSALTDHRIPATRESAAAPVSASDLLHFNSTPGKTLSALTLLQAYGQLVDKQPVFLDRFHALLDQCATSHGSDPLVLAALGRRALRNDQPAMAIPYLRKSLERGSVASSTFEDLAEALSRTDQMEEAVQVLRRGVEAAPFSPVLYKSMALRLIKLKRYPEAKQALERYTALFPEDDFVRGLLARVSGPG